ncbi:MAG: PIN domain-containing protein [Bifidobacteriaceae bacterium]|nr:PIN domain-containing protein [Bifidobacteriaceae bacterium]
MSVEAFIDTNVLIYFFDGAAPEKQRRARELLRSVRPVFSAQVLSEFYVVATRKLASPLSEADAAQSVEEWSRFRVMPITAELVRQATATSQAAQLSYWDALIVEAAAAAGCAEVLTEDLPDGAVLRGVRVRDPFADLRPASRRR